MTEIKRETCGVVRISDEVLMKIASTAAREAEGVLRPQGTKERNQAAKCISVAVNKQTVVVGIVIAVRFGTRIHEVAQDVQARVKYAMETMTGLTVAAVNVKIGSIIGEKAKR